MTKFAEDCALAIQHHQAGRLREAERICRWVLEREPHHAEMCHLLGMIAYQTGHLEAAIQCIQRAVQLKPADADMLNNLAVVLQSQGDLEKAIDCLREAMARQPLCPERCNNLGLAYARQGKLAEAVSCYEKALMLRPDYSEALFNGGVALRAQGNLEAAIDWYCRALTLRPNFVEALGNLGNALHGQGKINEAVACFRRVIELKPDDARAYNNFGTVLKDRGEIDDAIRNFFQAIRCDPGFAEAYFNLGIAYGARKSFDLAAECHKKAADLKPNFAQAYYELGNAFHALKMPHDAIDAYRQALGLNPSYAEALNNLGNVYFQLDNLGQAVGLFRRAIETRPNFVEAHNNLAHALQECGQIGEAEVSFRRAIELAPQQPEPHWNSAMLMLLQGDLEQGWPAYEWRWRTGKLTAPEYSLPKWDGELLEGKTILLHAEQGFGDTFQFVRYAAVMKDLGATVVFECQRPLRHLLTRCPGIDYLYCAGDEPPPSDFHCPLLSLPAILKTTLATIPAQIPYVFADPALINSWSDRLAYSDRHFLAGQRPAPRRFRMGINWHGRGGQGTFRKRDLPVEQFVALSALPGLQLICLQKEIDASELSQLSNCPQIFSPGDEFDTANGAFMDTAAIMKNLDLVITSDTAIAHLAGALGVPVWVVLPFVPDWRWLLDRTDSPWYPTMRLFRQKSPGDWAGVFDEIRSALAPLFHLRLCFTERALRSLRT